MSRDDGFQAADLDVKFLRDPKVRRLRRHLPDRGDAATAEHLYLAVVLSSWETGYRVPIDDAVAFEDVTPQRLSALQVELLDMDGKIPLAVWERWFRPAWERREKKRAGGREGNRRRWHADASPISDTDNVSLSDTDSDSESPSHPGRSVSSGPTGPSDPPKSSEASNGRRTNGRAVVPDEGPCRICGGHVRAIDDGSRVGYGWIEHVEHPDDYVAGVA